MGLRRISFGTSIKSPIVLHGKEGIIVRDALQIMASSNASVLGMPENSAAQMFYMGRPIYCEHELTTQDNKYNGYIS
jgi:hypothetical protein